MKSNIMKPVTVLVSGDYWNPPSWYDWVAERRRMMKRPLSKFTWSNEMKAALSNLNSLYDGKGLATAEKNEVYTATRRRFYSIQVCSISGLPPREGVVATASASTQASHEYNEWWKKFLLLTWTTVRELFYETHLDNYMIYMSIKYTYFFSRENLNSGDQNE